MVWCFFLLLLFFKSAISFVLKLVQSPSHHLIWVSLLSFFPTNVYIFCLPNYLHCQPLKMVIKQFELEETLKMMQFQQPSTLHQISLHMVALLGFVWMQFLTNRAAISLVSLLKNFYVTFNEEDIIPYVMIVLFNTDLYYPCNSSLLQF